MQKIIGVYDDRVQAENARKDLLSAGFGADQIDVLDKAPEAGKKEKAAGLWAKVKDFFTPGEQEHYHEASRRGSTIVAVSAGEDRIELAEDILERHNPSDIDTKAASWRKEGWKPGMGATEQKIPVAEEELKVGKRSVRGGGVRVHTRVTNRPVEERIELKEERVGVERRKVDRPAGEEAFEERVVEATETREEPVVSKEARVVEEVVVSKDTTSREATVKDRLRRTEVDVDKLDAHFREDFGKRFKSGGGSYEDYRPAYRYGYELSKRHGNKEWVAIQPAVRTDWDARNPNTFTRYEDAIRYGYEAGLRGEHIEE